MAEWDKKTRELRKKKLLRKQQVRDRGGETGSDDDDNDDDDEVAADVDWDVLEDEDMLTDAHRSMQGPFLFHAGGSEFVRSVEVGQTIGPSSGLVGAGESAATPGVPVEDRWMGGGGSTAAPEVSTERGGSATAPSKARETSPSAWEQGAGSKRSHPDKLEQETRGSSPKHSYCPTAPA